jgi:hypothetical protein
VPGGWTKLHNGGSYNLYPFRNIIRVLKPGMSWGIKFWQGLRKIYIDCRLENYKERKKYWQNLVTDAVIIIWNKWSVKPYFLN